MKDAESAVGKQSSLDEGQAAFDRLLAALDPDRDRAAVAYESLRRRLHTLFRFQGFSHSEDLFDKTMEIAARRLSEVAVENIHGWLAGIARNVCREARKRGHREVPLDTVPDLLQPIQQDAAEVMKLDRALECMNHCANGLDTEERKLLAAYYKYSKGEKIASHVGMARELEISIGNLRVRAFRLRKRLEGCVLKCLG